MSAYDGLPFYVKERLSEKKIIRTWQQKVFICPFEVLCLRYGLCLHISRSPRAYCIPHKQDCFFIYNINIGGEFKLCSLSLWSSVSASVAILLYVIISTTCVTVHTISVQVHTVNCGNNWVDTVQDGSSCHLKMDNMVPSFLLQTCCLVQMWMCLRF
jgi:hypothetical protein